MPYGEKLVEDSTVVKHDRELFQSDNETVQKLREDELLGKTPEQHKRKRDSELPGNELYPELRGLARYHIPSEQQTGTKPPGPEATNEEG
jgi:hypothetical protein